MNRLGLGGVPLPVWRAAAAALATLGLCHDPAAGQPFCPVMLDVGPVEVGSRSLSLCVQVGEGQYAALSLESCDGPLKIVVRGPAEKELKEFILAPESRSRVSFLAPLDGVVHLEVEQYLQGLDLGPFRVRLDERRVAGPSDQVRLRAERLVFLGDRLILDSTEESRRAAVRHWDEALHLWKELGDRRGMALTAHRIGLARLAHGAAPEASQSLELAFESYRETEDREGYEKAASDLVLAYALTDRIKEAERLAEEGAALAVESADPVRVARSLYGRGFVAYFAGRLDESISFLEQALAEYQAAGCRRGEAQCLLDRAFTLVDLGREQEAQVSFEQALSLWRRLGDRHREGETLRGLGTLCSKMDRRREALDYLDQARDLAQELGDRSAGGVILNIMGGIQLDLGEAEMARDYFEAALEIMETSGSRYAQASTLLELGRCHQSLNDFDEALDHYRRSLDIFQERQDRRSESILLRLIASALLAQGKGSEALQRAFEALRLIRETGDRFSEAETLNDLGTIQRKLGDDRAARTCFEEALTLNRRGGYRLGTAQALFGLAMLERDSGELSKALSSIEAGLGEAESIRTDVGGRDSRAAYFATVQDSFQLYVDLLMLRHQSQPSAGFDVHAFQASERARARSLLDSLAEDRFAIQAGVDVRLLERERQALSSLSSKAREQVRAYRSGAETPAALEKEIRQLTAEYEQLRALIRVRSPRYAALTQPNPLSLREVQKQVLDGETVLLEYSLGEPRSYLWMVEQDRHSSHVLTSRLEIEKAARSLWDMLTARQPRSGESTADRRKRISASEDGYWTAARELSNLLLGPVRDRLEDRRILIVSDGALRYLPFAALPEPGPQEKGADVPLVVNHEIVRLPSASALGVLRGQLLGRQPAEGTVAVLADPVFDRSDPRVTAGGVREEKEARVGGERLARLLASRREAETISSLVPPDSAFKAMGFQASRNTVFSAGLNGYRIVHFATHAVLDTEQPALSRILLSMVDESGQDQDGNLFLHDVYNLELPVELVVLSACDTALGREVRGEGLVGLVRGFMYSGAARVVASLWKADDEATRQLMERFYRGMLSENRNPAAALRAAQVEMWREREWSFPFFWGGFILQGEWRGLPN